MHRAGRIPFHELFQGIHCFLELSVIVIHTSQLIQDLIVLRTVRVETEKLFINLPGSGVVDLGERGSFGDLPLLKKKQLLVVSFELLAVHPVFELDIQIRQSVYGPGLKLTSFPGISEKTVFVPVERF